MWECTYSIRKNYILYKSISLEKSSWYSSMRRHVLLIWEEKHVWKEVRFHFGEIKLESPLSRSEMRLSSWMLGTAWACALWVFDIVAPKSPLDLTTSGSQTLTSSNILFFFSRCSKCQTVPRAPSQAVTTQMVLTALLCACLFSAQTPLSLLHHPMDCLTLLVSHREAQPYPQRNPSS